MSKDTGEKTFAPTARRKREAAKKGDVLRSKELATMAAMLVGVGWLITAGPWIFTRLATFTQSAFAFDRVMLEDFQPGDAMVAAMIVLLPPIMALAVPVMIATVAAQLSFGEGRWVASNLAFKGSRINPLSGLKRMFGTTGLIEMGKGLAKVGLLGTIAFLWGGDRVARIVMLGRGGLASQLTEAWDALTSLLIALTAGLLIIALIDLPIQWTRRNTRLKMSHQDMKEETKQTEGSPEARAARRQRQRDIARGSVMGAMREAQFVVTNPTHFALALTYDPERAAAPIVLARGRGEKALAMRELAAEFDLPVLEYPQLARAIYYTSRENMTIREELYAAVAAVLAFVYSLRRGENVPMPQINVPLALRFDANGRPEG